MKNLPLDFYPPLARKSVIFYHLAELANEPVNRRMGSWEASYYLLSHSVELAIKAVYELKTGKNPSYGHKLVPLAKRYKEQCRFSNEEIKILQELDRLNQGHGLRYPNTPEAEFLPSTFSGGMKITERLLVNFE